MRGGKGSEDNGERDTSATDTFPRRKTEYRGKNVDLLTLEFFLKDHRRSVVEAFPRTGESPTVTQSGLTDGGGGSLQRPEIGVRAVRGPSVLTHLHFPIEVLGPSVSSPHMGSPLPRRSFLLPLNPVSSAPSLPSESPTLSGRYRVDGHLNQEHHDPQTPPQVFPIEVVLGTTTIPS